MGSLLANLSQVVGNGFMFNGTATAAPGVAGTFGGADILGIFGIVLIIIIGVKYKASPDLIALSSVTMLEILAGIWFPSWAFVLFLIGGGAVFAMGLLKVVKNR